jgi:hypothetical protein
LQFVRLTTSGFSNNSYWDIILLHTQIQKFSSILKGLRKYRKKSLFFPFFVVFDQNVTRPHFMHKQLVTLIFLRVIKLIKFYHLRYLFILTLEKGESRLIKSLFFSLIHVIFWIWRVFLWSHEVVSYIKLFRLESSIILLVIYIILDHLLMQIPREYNEYLLINCFNYYHIFRE